MASRIARQGGTGILYDDSLVSHAAPALFEAASWPAAPAAPGYSGGRGATLFISHQGQDGVLRHYHRGGTVGRLLDDQFLWLGEDRTRSFREWRLLAALAELDLPAPRPLGACYRRTGLTYTADLITVRIPGVEPLSSRLARAGAPAEVWARVGECIGRFHRAQVWHADLTAHNLQINGGDQIFLLDFDRGRFRGPGGRWRQSNLDRLHRSLTKISEPDAPNPIHFSPREWSWLLDGYHGQVDHRP